MQAALRALADPTRRELLRRLRERPHTSGELAAGFASSWPTISRHLGVLRAAGLVTAERQGQQVVYDVDLSVVDEFLAELADWLRPARRGAPSATARAAMRARAGRHPTARDA